MTEFTYDHVHLRSPDPEADRASIMSACSAPRSSNRFMSDGRERMGMNLGGVMMFIAEGRAGSDGSREKSEGSLSGSTIWGCGCATSTRYATN